MFPVMTTDLALRLESVGASCLKQQPNNSFGLHINKLGDALCLMNKDLSLGPMFNRVIGFDDQTLPYVDSMVALCSKEHTLLRVDVNPYRATPALLKSMSAANLRPIRYQVALYGPCGPPKIVAEHSHGPKVAIKLVNAACASVWAKVWRESYGQSLTVKDSVIHDLAADTFVLHRNPNWHLYLATLNGEPAGVAAMFIHDNIGFLIMAGVMPQFRRHGCHMALIEQRLADAFQDNCQMIASVTELGSTSQHNLERSDLRIAHTRSYWVRFPVVST